MLPLTSAPSSKPIACVYREKEQKEILITERIRALQDTNFPMGKEWLCSFYAKSYNYYHSMCYHIERPVPYRQKQYTIICFPKRHVWIVCNEKSFPETVLGSGATKRVVKIWNICKGLLATLQLQIDENITAYWEREIRLLRVLEGSKFINSPVIVYREEPLYRMIVPYLESDLFSFLKQQPPKALRCIAIFHVVQGVRYLHEKKVVHKDLKLENVLIQTREGKITRIKIIDFAYSCLTQEKDCLRKPHGTKLYCAPEVVTCDDYSMKSDVYSTGVMCQLIYNRNFVFLPWMQHLGKNRDYLALNLMHRCSSRAPKEPLKYILWEMLQYQPKARINAKQASMKIRALLYDS